MKFIDGTLISDEDRQINGIVNGYQLLHSFINLSEIEIINFSRDDPNLKELQGFIIGKHEILHKELLVAITDFFNFLNKYLSLTNGPFDECAMFSSFKSEIIAVPIENKVVRIDAIRYEGDYELPFFGDWSFGSNYLEKERSYDISSKDELYLINEYEKWVFNEMGQTNLVSISRPNCDQFIEFLDFLVLNHFIDYADKELILENFERLSNNINTKV